MGWLNRMSENVKKGLRNWLQVTPSNPYTIQIQEVVDFELAAIRNRIWYRGDSNELEQMYMQNPDYADKHKFWASRCSPGQEMRKVHTGLPGLMVDVLGKVVLPDMGEISFESPSQKEIWDNVEKSNNFSELLEEALSGVLSIGDGAFKISIDTDISQYPILEWYPGDQVEFVTQRRRVREVVFKTPYEVKKQQYTLYEHYGYGYIKNHLYRGDTEVDMSTIEATAGVADIAFDSTVILAVPFRVSKSAKYAGRGKSIYDGKLDNFDALDEAWSQWMHALRKANPKTYMDEDVIPVDPNTGRKISPNPFDNSFIATESQASSGHGSDKDLIRVVQPDIPHESYAATYITALDLCLQGVLSPSTLGIDTKKLDNAEAQREKEKTTLYTRNAIVGALQKTLEQLAGAAINAYHILYHQPLEEVQADVPFGEYANPSFESQVETVGKAKTQGIMSTEACVDELYGDTRDDSWKQEEVERLKAEQGITTVEEPGVNMAAGDFQVNL